MKKNINETNIMSHEMRAAANFTEAWQNGDKYFHAAEAEAYKSLNQDELSTLLHSAIAVQQETGCLCLYNDPSMPSDARVDAIYKPSYAIAGVAIYAFETCPEVFDEDLNRFICDLLEGTFRYGIVGHGFETNELIRRTLLMLCKAGLRGFLEANHDQFPVFAEKIGLHMAHFHDLAKKIDEEQLIVTNDSFSTDSINHLIKELVARWNGNDRPVFVYGTLMKDERAHYMLSGCEFGGCFQLKDYAMYDLGSYPGIRPCPGESVLGELYFVSSDVVERMDEYEGEGSLYVRTSVQLHMGHSTFSAEAYVYNRDITGCRKKREVWNAHDEDLIWYAGYGSNLSSHRFSCYISGGTCAENGRIYEGSSDPTPARAVQKRRYPGTLYFGNESGSWGGCGVAFFDPNPKNKDERVYMKLYLITRRQLHDVMVQEGQSPNWYGRLVCLEIDDRGIPVYTLTSETRRTVNTPNPAYSGLIAGILEKEFKLEKRQINHYLGLK